MNVTRSALTIVLVVTGFAVAGAANQEPYYCWLAFGPEGKVRVLVRLEGSSITLQRRVGGKSKASHSSSATCRNKAPERGSYAVVMTTDESGKKCLFPDGVRPIVDVEFPPSERGARPVKRRYALDQFC